jgi:methionyl-tRNA synthetase
MLSVSVKVSLQITQEIFMDNYHNGNTLEQSAPQVYCKSCEKYLADRFVEGTMHSRSYLLRL